MHGNNFEFVLVCAERVGGGGGGGVRRRRRRRPRGGGRHEPGGHAPAQPVRAQAAALRGQHFYLYL